MMFENMTSRHPMQNTLKANAARAALEFIEDNMIIGVGTGTTVNYFIDALSTIKHRIDATVASSKATETRLRQLNIPVIDLNSAADLPIYIDGADEVNQKHEMIKGGGGALTREKIIASVAKTFICIVDESKYIAKLGNFPIAIEVLPMARSFVAREIVKLGGEPHYREGFVTDNGNIIIDVTEFDEALSISLENQINCIPGVIENGLFAKRPADIVIVSGHSGIKTFNKDQ